MSRESENLPFVCVRCGTEVPGLSDGSYRNHCPECLWSVHLDRVPGDRAASCGGSMEPVGVETLHGAWRIVHRCTRCGEIRKNRAATTDAVHPDRFSELIRLSRRPR